MYLSCTLQSYIPLPLSLFHPRWHRDNHTWLYKPWRMVYSLDSVQRSLIPMEAADEADQYRNHGDHILGLKLLADEYRASLTGESADRWASFAASTIAKAQADFAAREAQKKAIPTELPMVESTKFKRPGGDKRKRRAFTGVDVEEARERAESRERHEERRRIQPSQPTEVTEVDLQTQRRDAALLEQLSAAEQEVLEISSG